eukprot:11143706-Ditylum_brightwellii.AAC.1
MHIHQLLLTSMFQMKINYGSGQCDSGISILTNEKKQNGFYASVTCFYRIHGMTLLSDLEHLAPIVV